MISRYERMHAIFETILEKRFFSIIASGVLTSGALGTHPTMFYNEQMKANKLLEE
jgi:hypothetical protein